MQAQNAEVQIEHQHQGIGMIWSKTVRRKRDSQVIPPPNSAASHVGYITPSDLMILFPQYAKNEAVAIATIHYTPCQTVFQIIASDIKDSKRHLLPPTSFLHWRELVLKPSSFPQPHLLPPVL